MTRTQTAKTERQILETAAALLTKRGVRGVSMRAIAERVGITPGAIYRHFSDKQALVDRVVTEAFRALEVRLLKAITPLPLGSFARIVALGEAYITFAQENPEAFKLLFDPFSRGVRKVRDFPGEVYPILRQCVVDAIDGGELRPADPDLVTFFLWSRVHGILLLLMACDFSDELSKHGLTPLELFGDTREFVARGLLGKPARTKK